MRYVHNTKQALKEVYQSRMYLAFTMLFALTIFSFNTVINNYRILLSDFSFKLFFILLGGTINAMTTISIILLVLMSILAGVVLSMSIFLVKRQVKGSIGASSSTVLVSLVAPACPSCAIGLLSVLGFGSFLAVLPFKGLELGIFALILLSVSVVYLSTKIVTKTCSIKPKGGKKKWKKSR